MACQVQKSHFSVQLYEWLFECSMAARARHDQAWVKGFRVSIRTSTAEGWWVREHRDRMRLEVKTADGRMTSVALHFDWAKGQTGDAVARVRSIYRLVGEGHTLKTAATLAAGEAPAAPIDWPAVAERFRVQKLQQGTTVKPEAWEAHYLPVVSAAVELLCSRKAPMNPADLMDQCIRAWPPGSRTRQIRAQSLAQFLRFGVHRAGLPVLWVPPSELRQHVGTKSREAASATQKGDPFTDQQILNFIDGLPQNEAGCRWADSVRLMAELGLRPIELLHLTIRADSATREPYWWCTYRKRSGGGSTDSRRLFPLPLIAEDGQASSWNLMQRWQANLIELPPLNSGNSPADCIKTYLSRQQSWKSLRQVMAANAQRAVPYSFRHSYSLRGHQRVIDAGSMAHAMGHSFEVHCRSYPWASAAGTIAAFQRANASVALAPIA